jgi:hypothetical protein
MIVSERVVQGMVYGLAVLDVDVFMFAWIAMVRT